MPNQSISLTDFDPDVMKIQRAQRMADMLQQQASDAIPINSYNGIQAPISPFSVLAKALKGYSARKYQDQADQGAEAYRSRDLASSQALARQLTENRAPIAPVTSQLDPTAPTLPGQAPQPAQPSIPMTSPGQAGGMPSSQEQMAMLLGAHGGPQTQMIQNTMLPQIMNRQNLDYQHQLGREDKTWELGQPMSTAARQTMDAQAQSAKDLAKYKNDLPETAHETAQDKIERDKLNELHGYHQMITGAGLTGDDPVVGSHVKNILAGNETMQNVPARYKNAVSVAMADAPKAAFTPLAMTRNTLASERITAPYRKMPGYELTASAPVYLDRIDAAMNHPNSIGDQDALDALTKLNTGGNAVTDAQVRLITDGKSLGDWFGVAAGRLKNGGVLSPYQRQQVQKIANEIAGNYAKSYKPIYDQATSQLTEAGIPKQFWTIPDLNKLSERRARASDGGMSSQDRDALNWANANPKDPRAAQIKQHLGQ